MPTLKPPKGFVFEDEEGIIEPKLPSGFVYEDEIEEVPPDTIPKPPKGFIYEDKEVSPEPDTLTPLPPQFAEEELDIGSKEGEALPPHLVQATEEPTLQRVQSQFQDIPSPELKAPEQFGAEEHLHYKYEKTEDVNIAMDTAYNAMGGIAMFIAKLSSVPTALVAAGVKKAIKGEDTSWSGEVGEYMDRVDESINMIAEIVELRPHTEESKKALEALDKYVISPLAIIPSEYWTDKVVPESMPGLKKAVQPVMELLFFKGVHSASRGRSTLRDIKTRKEIKEKIKIIEDVKFEYDEMTPEMQRFVDRRMDGKKEASLDQQINSFKTSVEDVKGETKVEPPVEELSMKPASELTTEQLKSIKEFRVQEKIKQEEAQPVGALDDKTLDKIIERKEPKVEKAEKVEPKIEEEITGEKAEVKQFDISKQPHIEVGKKVKGTNEYILNIVDHKGKELGWTIEKKTPQSLTEVLKDSVVKPEKGEPKIEADTLKAEAGELNFRFKDDVYQAINNEGKTFTIIEIDKGKFELDDGSKILGKFKTLKAAKLRADKESTPKTSVTKKSAKEPKTKLSQLTTEEIRTKLANAEKGSYKFDFYERALAERERKELEESKKTGEKAEKGEPITGAKKEKVPIGKNKAVINEMIREMEDAEAGKRIFNEADKQGSTLDIIGVKSTFPDWYKKTDSVYKLKGKKEVINILNKVEEGKPLTEKQKSIFEKMVFEKRGEAATTAYKFRKFKKGKVHTINTAQLGVGDKFKRPKDRPDEPLWEVKEVDPEKGVLIEDGVAERVGDFENIDIVGKVKHPKKKEIQEEIDVPEQVRQKTKAEDMKIIADAEMKQKKKTTVEQKEVGGLFKEQEEAAKGGDLFEAKEPVSGSGGRGGKADIGGYAENLPYKPSLIEMPELVDLAKDLLKGKLPSVKKKLRLFGGRALGVFRHVDNIKGEIDLKADIFKDESVAAKVLAHEIGHLADWLPDKHLKRGNILGHVAALKKHMKSLLEEYPGSPHKILTPKDRAKLRYEAKKSAEQKQAVKPGTKDVNPEEVLAIWKDNAAREKDPGMYDYIARLSKEQKKELMKAAMKKIIPDWFAFKKGGYTTAEPAIKDLYQELLRKEILKRRLFEEKEIKQELKNLTQQWKPFNEHINPSPEELYADAVSVLLNNPELLKSTAPKFNKAFFNYLEKRPEVKEAYESIQALTGSEKVLEKRDVDIDTMIGEEGETALREAAKADPLDLLNVIKKEIIDINSLLIKKYKAAKKAGKNIPVVENPVYWVEELPYISSEMFQHLRDVNNNILNKIEGKGINIVDIGKYQFLKRVEIERADKANPLGQTPTTAVKQLEFLKKKWGDRKFNDVKKYAEEFNRIRQENVISVLEKSNMLDPELMKTIKSNEAYVTFDVQKYLEKRYGRGIGAEIHQQIGTLENITNPFTATLMKDASLVRAANVKIIKENVINSLKKHSPGDVKKADTRWNGSYREPIESKDPKLKMIAYLDKGEVKAYYLPKDIADSFKRDPFEAGKIWRGLEIISAPLKQVFVIKNPFFTLWNIQRDVKAFAKQLPGASIPKAIKYIIKSSPEAYADVFRGKSSPRLRKAYKGKMLIIDRHFRAIEKSPEAQIDRMIMNFGISDKTYHNNVVKPFVKTWQALDKPGKFSERVVKIAGLRYLEDIQAGKVLVRGKKRKLEDREIAHLVRTRAGSPDFLRGGLHRRTYNTLFFFSNAGVGGIRAAIESAREMPASYAWKTLKYDIAPKVIMHAASIGALGEGVKGIMDMIPERDKENYITIPLGKTKTGKAVYAVIPHDFQGQVVGGLLWDSLQAQKATDIKAMLDFMGGGMPYSSLNPLIGWAMDTWQLATGKNPYNEFTGRDVIPPQIFEARDSRTIREYLKYTSNTMGGSVIYRFRYEDVEKIKTELEKIYDVPLASSFVRRFIRVSDRGLADKARRTKREVRAKNARELLDAKDAITKIVNGEKLTEKDLESLQKKSNIIKRDLFKKLNRKNGNALYNSWVSASKRERAAIFEKLSIQIQNEFESLKGEHKKEAERLAKPYTKPKKKKSKKLKGTPSFKPFSKPNFSR